MADEVEPPVVASYTIEILANGVIRVSGDLRIAMVWGPNLENLPYLLRLLDIPEWRDWKPVYEQRGKGK